MHSLLHNILKKFQTLGYPENNTSFNWKELNIKYIWFQVLFSFHTQSHILKDLSNMQDSIFNKEFTIIYINIKSILFIYFIQLFEHSLKYSLSIDKTKFQTHTFKYLWLCS